MSTLKNLKDGVVKRCISEDELHQIMYTKKPLYIDNRRNKKEYTIAFRYLNYENTDCVIVDDDGTATIHGLNKAFTIEEFNIPAGVETTIDVNVVDWKNTQLLDYQYCKGQEKFVKINHVLQYCPTLEVDLRNLFLCDKTEVTVDDSGTGTYECKCLSQGKPCAGNISFSMEI